MRFLAAGLSYFAAVFGAGFVLGLARVWWAAPRFGMRMTELIEMPLMLIVIVLAARWVTRQFAVPSSTASRFGMGGVALALLVLAELSLVIWLQSQSIAEYLAERDPVSGAVYCLMLVVFAVMPLLVNRH